MATTIRINDKDKEELDKLQAEIFLASGRKLSYPEIMNLILKLSRAELKNSIFKLLKTPQNIDWERASKFIEDFGFSDSSDIDEVLYG